MGGRWPGGTTLVFALGAGLVGGALVAGAWAVFGDDGGVVVELDLRRHGRG